jgi:biotin transport system substrate-specific component
VGDLAILTCGALWLAVETQVPAKSVLTLAVLPFLAGDALKVIAAATLASGARRLRRRTA